MKKRTFRFVAWLSETIAPAECKCMNCGREVFDGLGFCPDCKQSVEYNNGKTCKRCGVGIDGDEDYCGNCAFDKMYFERAYSVFDYEGAVRDAILRFKFNNCGNFARIFAKYLAFAVKQYEIDFDLVAYTPMTKKGQRKRGYNQSELLAEYFCAILGCEEKCIEGIAKIKETKPQEMLRKAERKTNLLDAYRCIGDVAGKRVLVIDDIKTTGATLNECAKVLKRAGAASVVGLTVASRRENFVYEVEDEG